jgi:antitoxin component YwqK of YwqJK toxin-antitoxin module
VVDDGVLRDYLSYYDDGSIAVTASRAVDGTMSRTDRWRNGNLKEEFFTDSIGNGKCTNYFENGKKQQEGMLFRFTPSGDWLRWDSLGNQLSDTTYGTPVSF